MQFKRWSVNTISILELCLAITFSHWVVADTTSLSAGDPLGPTKDNRSIVQSVVKSTSANAITIEYSNLDEKPAQLAQQSNSDNKTKKPKEKKAVSSAQQAGLFRIYRSNLLKKTYQHVIYPESAVDRNQQGDVVLTITISREGEVKSVDYRSRAEFNSLNKAATKAVFNAKPYPPAPARLQGETFEVVMPIRFRLAG
jgi:TonB family protein